MAIFGTSTKNNEPEMMSEISPPGNLLVEHNDLKSEEFDVNIIKWTDESKPDYNKMIVHPIELGNILEFRNKNSKNFTGKGTRMENIISIERQVQMKGGFLRKKEDTMLEIMLSNKKSLVVDIEDKQAQYIIDILEKSKNYNAAQQWQSLSFPIAVEDGSIRTIELLPSSPFFAPGEQVLWSSIGTEGILKTHIVFLNALTNYRILQYDFKSHLANYVTMGAIEDVVVTNQRRISESSGSGVYTGTRLGYTRTGVGNTRSRSTGVTVGDVTFIHQGRAVASVTQIKDPHGLSRLAKSAKKQYALLEKTMKKVEKTEVRKGLELVTCNKCGTSNTSGSNFCNKCGNTLS